MASVTLVPVQRPGFLTHVNVITAMFVPVVRAGDLFLENACALSAIARSPLWLMVAPGDAVWFAPSTMLSSTNNSVAPVTTSLMPPSEPDQWHLSTVVPAPPTRVPENTM